MTVSELCGDGMHLPFGCAMHLLRYTNNATTMATMVITIETRTMPPAHASAIVKVRSEGGPAGVATEQACGSKESITTGHVVSTWSCVEATVMGGVEATQEVRREGTSTAGSSVYESSARNTTV